MRTPVLGVQWGRCDQPGHQCDQGDSRSSGIIPVHNKRLVSQAQWLYEDLKNEYCKKILDKLIDNETHFLFDKNNIANI